MKNLIPFILIPLSVALFFFYVRPEYSTVRGLLSKKAEYENVNQKAQDLATLRNELMSQYNNISDADKQKLQQVIPEHFEAVRLVANLNGIANKYGMIVSDVTIQNKKIDLNQGQSQVSLSGSATTDQPYQTGVILFTVSGQYKNFTAFLKDVEASQNLFDVKKITIDLAKKTSVAAAGSFDFGVVVETYFIN